MKRKLEEIETELHKLSIDTNTDEGKLEALAYFYKILQKDIKYFNPRIRLGKWECNVNDFQELGVQSPDNSYGALIENYALCEGISHGFELLCNYFDMDCDTIGVKCCGVGHAINRIRLSDGKVSFIDVASEIGMGDDGLYENAHTRRLVPKEKVDTTTQFFLVDREFLKSKYFTSVDYSNEFEKYDCSSMYQTDKNKLMEALQRKMKPQISINKPTINFFNRTDNPR